MVFVPQVKKWPADRAVLLVHGIGNASGNGDAAFPLAELKVALGADAPKIAIYTLNYDFINDWAARKLQLGSAIDSLGKAIAEHYNNAELSATLAEYCGDLLWPVLHRETRLAIHDAYLAQLDQIMVDCINSMAARGEDPATAKVSIIAHSLGCYHTFEALHTACTDPQFNLQPGTDLTQLESVVLMASPVQLMRTVASDIKKLIPRPSELAILNEDGLSLPAEIMDGERILAARQFVSVTGTQDPVGGHLLGKRNDWAFMNITGQRTLLVNQSLVAGDPVTSLKAALMGDATKVGAVASLVKDPHSWSEYVSGQSKLLTELFTPGLVT